MPIFYMVTIYVWFSLPSRSKRFSMFLCCPFLIIITAGCRRKVFWVHIQLQATHKVLVQQRQMTWRFLLSNNSGSDRMLLLKYGIIRTLKQVVLIWFSGKCIQFLEDWLRDFSNSFLLRSLSPCPYPIMSARWLTNGHVFTRFLCSCATYLVSFLYLMLWKPFDG